MEEIRLSDSELIRLLKDAPSEGLGKAIALYGGAVKTICSNVLGSGREADVEECVADVFTEFWRSLERYDEGKGGTLKSYIYGIARHKAIDRRRKLKRADLLIPIDENEIGYQVDFEDEAARKINAGIVQGVVDELPPPDREIFIYRYFFYEAVAAIADKLGLDKKTVENKLYRGKAKLRGLLTERGVIL